MIKEELWINSYQEMMDLCTPDWEFFEEVESGFKWPRMEDDHDEGTYNTLVYIREIPAINVSPDDVLESRKLMDRISMAESLMYSKLVKQESERRKLRKKIIQCKSKLLAKFFGNYPLMRVFNFQRSILSILVLLRGSYRLGSDKAIDLAITVCSLLLAEAYALF
jgi:hypothetical protein